MALTTTKTITDIVILEISNLVTYEKPAETAWQTGLNVALGQRITQADGAGDFYYEVTTAGTTGTEEPTWPFTEGDTVADGTAAYVAKKRKQYEGTPIVANQRITYLELDENGDPSENPKHETVPLTDAELFSTTLGVTEQSGTVRGNSAGNRVAKDSVKDHQKDVHDWAKVKVKAIRGI
jgi:hypothetical protein